MNGEAGEAMGDGSFAALMEEARKYNRDGLCVGRKLPGDRI